MRRTLLCILLLIVISLSALAQQDYVGRLTTYGAYSYFNTPSLNLTKRGFNGQAGVNLNKWVAFGVDYSYLTGHSSIVAKQLNGAKQTQLAGALAQLAAAGQLPPGYVPNVPYDATTWTFAIGPQLNYRGFKWATFYIHPSLGMLQEEVRPKATDPIGKALTAGLVGNRTAIRDRVPFYGVGGGIDANLSQHVSIRVNAEYVHTDLYNSLLGEKQNTVRVSIGPAFHFGGNVARK